MKLSTFTRLSLAATAASFLLIPGASAQEANARNVRLVNYAAGTYIQDSPTTWREDAGSNGQFRFIEVSRTDRGVYLYDAGRRVNIVLDMFQRKVLYSDPLQSFPLYDITSESAKINGRIVRLVRYMDKKGALAGGFSQQADRKWVEFGPTQNVKFNYTEAARDDWSVYLQDATRGVSIQIDLHTRKVIHSDRTITRQPLYDVAAAE